MATAYRFFGEWSIIVINLFSNVFYSVYFQRTWATNNTFGLERQFIGVKKTLQKIVGGEWKTMKQFEHYTDSNIPPGWFACTLTNTIYMKEGEKVNRLLDCIESFISILNVYFRTFLFENFERYIHMYVHIVKFP